MAHRVEPHFIHCLYKPMPFRFKACRPAAFFLTAASVSLGWSLPATAQVAFSKPAAAVEYRQALFRITAAHAQNMGRMAKDERPFDKALAENDAAVIEQLSRQLDTAFPPGSDTANSKANPEVWQDAAGFKQKLTEFKLAAAKLNAAARSGDAGVFKAAYNATAQTCKACHDGFRHR